MLDLDAHGLRCPHDGFADRLQRHVLAIRIRLLDLGDLVNVLGRHGARDLVARVPTPGLQARCFLQKVGCGRGFHHEIEGVVLVGRHHDRHGHVRFDMLRPRVEVLAERHEVEPMLS